MIPENKVSDHQRELWAGIRASTPDVTQTHQQFTCCSIHNAGHHQCPTHSSDPRPFPGALPAPTLNLNPTSAKPGDSVKIQCSVSSQPLVTRIVFCKDGEEVSSQRGLEKTVYSYDDAVSRGSSGNYSCGYEIKGSNNQVTSSQLSLAKYLSVTGDDSSSGARIPSPPGMGRKLLLGITVPAAAVVLAVVLYLLGRKVVSLRRDQRERVQQDTSNNPENQIQYASVNFSRSTRSQSQPQREETPTYATIALQRDRRHDYSSH
ncbi:uncharacterized protein LOC112545414 isoform X1 [Pelodiscus sinensis]|uniref:uncharacterized protein LOC112545414 isoform X1 n=1 Tax=Pelodiscus sinensis TaxID=13735 RepID=UPI003F6B84C8